MVNMEGRFMMVDWIEGVGFSIEILFFVGAGFFFFVNIYIALLLYLLGIVTAYFVGQRIKWRVINKINNG